MQYVAQLPEFGIWPAGRAQREALSRRSRALIGEFSGNIEASTRTMAPEISPDSFGKDGPFAVSRVIDRDKAIVHQALHCQTMFRVPAARHSSAQLDPEVLAPDIFKSIKSREEIDTNAGRITRTRLHFFTLTSKIPVKPSGWSESDALWACRALGLLNGREKELLQLDFHLVDRVGHLRPSIFSAGAYEAFCAADRPDGFGRTAELNTGREMAPEFVCGVDRHPLIVGVKRLGRQDWGVAPEVNHLQIQKRLRAEARP
jgi:hypothetical protein